MVIGMARNYGMADEHSHVRLKTLENDVEDVGCDVATSQRPPLMM